MKVDDYLKTSGKQETAGVTFSDLRALEEEGAAAAPAAGATPPAPTGGGAPNPTPGAPPAQ